MTEQQRIDVVAGSITGAYAGTNVLPDPPIDFFEAMKELGQSLTVKVSGIPVNKIEIDGHVTF